MQDIALYYVCLFYAVIQPAAFLLLTPKRIRKAGRAVACSSRRYAWYAAIAICVSIYLVPLLFFIYPR